MTEKEFERLSGLRKLLSDECSELTKLVKEEEFQSLDGLNKDLIVTQATAMQSLVGIISIRLGVNHNNLNHEKETEVKTKETDNAKEEAAEVSVAEL